MNIHIIGIAGKTSAALAKMLIDEGHIVTGSDQGCYPPMTDFLDEIGVSYQTPYDEANMPDDTDELVVAGNALIVNPNNPEYLKAKEMGLPIKSYPEVLGDFLIKDNSIVVVGNYGKGTVSGAFVKALTDLDKNPSYMVGGLLEDFTQNVVASNSDWSVVEGDEYPVPPIGDSKPRSKFFYYKPKYVVLTSAEWDHFDKFPSEREYIENYVELVKDLPQDGLLVANYDGENVMEVVKHASCRVVTYSLINPHADYVADEIGFQPTLLGRFNLSNLTGAYAMLAELGFDNQRLLHSLNHYRGLKQRMTVLHEDENVVVVRDLAHSPIKAKSAVAAAKETWPNYRIVAVLDIYSSSLKNRNVLPRLSGSLSDADLVLIPKVTLSKSLDENVRITGKEIVDAVKETQPNVKYLPKHDDLVAAIKSYPKPKVVLLMSSGSMQSIEEEILKEI
ncbi:hypothetical protein KC614_02865 [candidate division WWE3 bacterium]|uniref:Mur ligase central domain-containing protein n=1 Tax=candidate division WWE3 bacterium TaxID=2053526 RepID=A0A955LKC0_UNCKA|nr:hypothetical protein [candidate division WWE3 bacterium]